MARQTLKPPFEYYGGKTHLAPRIASLLPPHDHYVEPFAGSLAVLLAKEPSRAETVNDLDGDLVTFWRVLRNRPEELERVCALTPHSVEEFVAAADRTDCDDLEAARRVFVVLTQGREHSLKPRDASGWRRGVKASGRVTMPRALGSQAARISAVAERMAGVSLENDDAINIIRRYGREPSVCIYADPPYLGDTRGSGGGYGIDQKEGGFHQAFADACNEAKASVIISGYDSPLYEELFEGWHRIELTTRPTQSLDRKMEVLWSNQPFAGQTAFDFGGVA
nr:MAG TPA: DNA adenine methylase [Caudoviricetes sp.]